MEENLLKDWFNIGYALSEQKPELAKSIQESFSLKDDIRAQGFIAGHKQFVQDKEKGKEKSKIPTKRNFKLPKSTANKIAGKDKSKGKTKD